MRKHLVLVGGGHAHMVTLANLHKFIEKGHKVTVVGPSPFHYYSGMGPGLLGKMYAPEKELCSAEDSPLRLKTILTVNL